MGNVKIAYAPAPVAFTFNGLANPAYAISGITAAAATDSVDNTTNLFMDAMVDVTWYMSAGTGSQGDAGHLYFYGSMDNVKFDTTTILNPLSAVNATAIDVTWTNLITKGFAIYAKSSPIKIVVPSVAAYLGNVLPPYWGVILQLYGTANPGQTSARYRGIYLTN